MTTHLNFCVCSFPPHRKTQACVRWQARSFQVLCCYERVLMLTVVGVHHHEVTDRSVPHPETAASQWSKRKHSPALFPVSCHCLLLEPRCLPTQGDLSLMVHQNEKKKGFIQQNLPLFLSTWLWHVTSFSVLQNGRCESQGGTVWACKHHLIHLCPTWQQ